MPLDIIKTDKGFITDKEFENKIFNLDLDGKDVIVYSRLLSFGRLLGIKAVNSIISILKSAVGEKGTLIFPTYTLGSYDEPRVFNEKTSKVMSGILGEKSLLDNQFRRLIHPIYSHSIYNDNDYYISNHSKNTCFGKNSFFDLFSNKQNGVVLMLGLNFNGPSLYHYYDQKYNAKGRFIKEFEISMFHNEENYFMKFDSYVKEYKFYNKRTNCLGRLEAMAKRLGILRTELIGDSYIHLINEINFNRLYKICLLVDQNYFLMSSKKNWNEYYINNNFKYFYKKMNQNKVDRIKKLWEKSLKTKNYL